MTTNDELRRWKAEVEMWRTLDVWPANGTVNPRSPQGGLWHDCSWVERCSTLLQDLAAKDRRIEMLEKFIRDEIEHCPRPHAGGTCGDCALRYGQLARAAKEGA